MADRKNDEQYRVILTGREIYWLIRLANKELLRLQYLSVEEGNPMLDANRNQRWWPISDAFSKLHQVGESDMVDNG